MASPVIIIYGQKVQKRVLYHMDFDYTIFPLWDRAKDISLILFHEKSFCNAEPGHRICRIGLCAAHPQFLFYAKRDSPVTQMQDKIIGIAKEMVSDAVPVIPNYYSEKKWLINNITTLNWFAKTDNGVELDSSSAQNPPLSTNTIRPKWSSPFLEFRKHPHDVKTSRYEILPSALRAVQYDKSEWEVFSDIPIDV